MSIRAWPAIALVSLAMLPAAFGSAPARAARDKVLPYAGVVDKDGVPFSGAAVMNFALFDCTAQAGACNGSSTQLWVASGAGAFPPAGATGLSVTASDGRFSLLLGDDNPAQNALPVTVFRTAQLYVRVAIRASNNSWVALSGFQRIAPVASAISAEEAGTFTVRNALTVGGPTRLNGTTTTDDIVASSLLTNSVTSTGTVAGAYVSSSGEIAATTDVRGRHFIEPGDKFAVTMPQAEHMHWVQFYGADGSLFSRTSTDVNVVRNSVGNYTIYYPCFTQRPLIIPAAFEGGGSDNVISVETANTCSANLISLDVAHSTAEGWVLQDTAFVNVLIVGTVP